MDLTSFFFFFFWMEQIPNLGNSSTHKLLPPFSHLNPKDTPGQNSSRRKPTFFYNSPTSLEFSILSITNDGSIQLNPFKLSMDDHWKPNGGKYNSYLTLSLAFDLCLLSIIYYLLTTSFFLSSSSSSSSSFLSFLYFIPMLDIRFLLFCNFTTAKLFTDCSRKTVSFWGYPLLARCLIIVQDKKHSKQRRYLY